MCGIVGYVGKGSSLQMLVDGLKRLEYRGYDSAGVAFLNGKGMDIYKTKGKLLDLQKILPDPLPSVRIGLGHTRWATHGVPSAKNAHPHIVGGIAVVHNGIIENYRELRTELESEGHTFLSQTDTEVVPHLIARSVHQGLSLMASIEQAVQRLRGSYALGILCEKCPDMLIAIRKGSPLVLGIGDGEFFFASDIPAILPYTKKVIFMEDGQLCALTAEGIQLIDHESSTVIPTADRTVTIDWTPAMAEKCGHDHFMHKEIHEQPQAIMNTIGEWIDDPPSVLNKLGIYAHRRADLRRLHLTASGTSYHAALVGKYMIERLARIPVSVDIASEYRYREPIIEAGTLFISITQSGETADTLAAQREAKKMAQ
jgi:glucosamine--fructose-6-phosphate aminotransferase (isomerizing)